MTAAGRLRWPLAVFWTFAIADWALTADSLRRGLVSELNPVMAWAFDQGDLFALAVKVAVYAGVTVAVLELARRGGNARLVAWFAGAAMVAVVVYQAAGRLVIA